MAARTKARKRALDLLFEAEQRQVNVGELLRQRLAAPVTEAPLSEFTGDLVSGVVEHWTQIDELIATYSQGWTLARMPAVDRSIRNYGVGAQILLDLGVRDMIVMSSTRPNPAALEGYGLRIVGWRDMDGEDQS